jgi:hypothetical protein
VLVRYEFVICNGLGHSAILQPTIMRLASNSAASEP